MSTWKLQEAKEKFSEVVKRALSEGPQGITVRGESVAVLISRAECASLAHPKPGFVEFMRQSPLVGLELETERGKRA
ncbi:type II toxin-antitoxin system prevent-host-death family antitoxin [Polaromonas glacialis]|uniref:type II toxin-antitoxin system prevent-host-death family antitoxin n=1 Tax=Polaromonas glacialis TaxID=866564 RepID=UPI00049564A9|nr:type II toxin-antitoxin system prevent-host-death family antitoxin [Polaromonas glacialis]